MGATGRGLWQRSAGGRWARSDHTTAQDIRARVDSGLKTKVVLWVYQDLSAVEWLYFAASSAECERDFGCRGLAVCAVSSAEGEHPLLSKAYAADDNCYCRTCRESIWI